MALIRCSECGKDVSDKASNYPNCGNPVGRVEEQTIKPDIAPQEIKKNPIWIFVFIFILIIGALFLYFNQINPYFARKNCLEQYPFALGVAKGSPYIPGQIAKAEEDKLGYKRCLMSHGLTN